MFFKYCFRLDLQSVSRIGRPPSQPVQRPTSPRPIGSSICFQILFWNINLNTNNQYKFDVEMCFVVVPYIDTSTPTHRMPTSPSDEDFGQVHRLVQSRNTPVQIQIYSLLFTNIKIKNYFKQYICTLQIYVCNDFIFMMKN